MSTIIKSVILATALFITAGSTASMAMDGDKLLKELVRQGSVVHTGGMLAGR